MNLGAMRIFAKAIAYGLIIIFFFDLSVLWADSLWGTIFLDNASLLNLENSQNISIAQQKNRTESIHSQQIEHKRIFKRRIPYPLKPPRGAAMPVIHVDV